MPNEKIRERNIEHVLSTAARCFSERGIEGTTLNELAWESGVSLRSVNRYFKNKTDLVICAYKWLGGRIFETSQMPTIEDVDFSEKSGAELFCEYLSLLRYAWRGEGGW